MALDFDSACAVYDDRRDSVTFTAVNGSTLVRCSVTRQALTAMARLRADSAGEMLEAYRSHAAQIHRIADGKYNRHMVDLDGTVLIIQRDVT
jgi:hypothetical protein